MLITDKVDDDYDQFSSLLNTVCICESGVFIKRVIPTYAERSQKGYQNQCDTHNAGAQFSPFRTKVVSLLFLANLNGSQIMGGNFV